jgi:alpha-aminoadipic semialdehyde synthase
MNKKVALRYEDRFKMERRVSIIPKHVEKLSKKYGLEFYVETSAKRIFSDKEFETAGAKIVDNVNNIPVIFGVKEMPLDIFQPNHTYIFFSHTIKGQTYNMPALKKMVEQKVNLIDYEKVRDEHGRRTIFFGKYAGFAGMINTLWALGLRLKEKGIRTPFEHLMQSHKYNSLDEAKTAISKVGMEIVKNGLPSDLTPLVLGITGYGNVANGAQEILSLLPVKEISPKELLKLNKDKTLPNNVLYKVIFKEWHLATPIDDTNTFDLQDYYQHPEKYKGTFEQYIDKLTVLINAMYWDKRYPKLITNEYLKEYYNSNHKLQVIGDITCDPKGSIECTTDCTTIENPLFVFDTNTGQYKYGVSGEGIVIMGVDILPSELPRESSIGFSDALFDYVNDIVTCDYSDSYQDLKLPAPIKRALILHNGNFTPEFKYMEEYIK